jgi:radical SAM protein with 4Fe4S-binding SPASM domain
MGYGLMRFKKYYVALKTNKPLLKTTFAQKSKIILNIIKFFMSYGNPVLKNKPVVAQIEATSHCNLKCKMCIRDKMGIPIGNMSFEDFKIILNKMDSLFKIHLQGQGESFLNPELFKMIRYANKRGVLIMLNTNGTILTPKIIEEICNVEIGGITVSIDSVKKENYEKIRIGANFEKVLNNVKSLTTRLKERKKGTVVSLATVILRDNLNELPYFVHLASKLGAKRILFQTIQGKKDYVDKYDAMTKKQVNLTKENLKDKIEETKRLAKKEGINVVFDQEKSTGCVWPWRSIYITWNGYVTPCCKILDYRKPLFGNLLKEDFWKIWNGKDYQTYRKLLIKRKAPLNCLGCNNV